MRLLHVFYGANMGCRQKGLLAIADKKGLPLSKLQPGDVLAFINKNKDKISMIGISPNLDPVLGYFVSADKRLTSHSFNMIPYAFGGGAIKVSSAMKSAFVKALHLIEKAEAA